MQNQGKFTLGLILGAAAGAAIAYFLDETKRVRFVEGVSATAEKVQDSVVEGYYEAKDRYQKYRDKLARATRDLKSRVEEKAEEVEEFIEEKLEH
ncbi:hypothetical protein HQ45_03940 [Porphyromonas crevioricanis]|uniref:Gas vesicle protein n=2 Tax=Porphyromonas crevioricanis TaxID=393921 RepID=A0A0A2FG75_9PORP|nr:YtxH domain-containing protein [Porphyromonas crevioricanis]KGN89983.1 hypothetical protein HQ45_03940 [Porphyromonas crevioricanis]KGN94164.1 hypothetical protein HQ38_06420 [Porphyromonas crevioricanis]SJZ67749.1 YtxH-like protein [Porphyromonas crevioricanis]SQH73979.1 Uncharacterised protein [Porphyromonas crevioricanis]GAD04629.1 hypothetical protein PORCRE_319 [Porphyromonas crevioricanis JCM 15906]